MGYREALEAAGAKVEAFEEFGSYQGDWIAKVEINGKRGWVHDYYGSCSGCDAFEAEFSYRNEETPEKLAAFGKTYLDDLKTDDEILVIAGKHSAYSVEDVAMLKWVKNHIAGAVT